MSDKEIRQVKLNCLTDFQRAAILYQNNGAYNVFFEHGKSLLEKLHKKQLLMECQNIQKLKKKLPANKIADRILTVGLLANC